MTEERNELLALDAAERVATFQSKGKIYRHVFSRLTSQHWEKFFSNIIVEFKQEGGGYSQLVDTDVASLELYAKAVLRVEGYSTRDGSDPRNLPTWPECIPQNHRFRAVDALTAVSRDEMDESLLDADLVTVKLNALWNESAPGAMKEFRGLEHRFRVPTADHRRRYLKGRNRAFIAGGSRRGLTIIPSSHAVMLRLYDELIESVEGYSVGGAPLSGREAIAREMDLFHKQAAVSHLFPASDRAQQAEATEAA